MWIKTETGNLVNLDQFAKFYYIAGYFDESEEKRVAVVGIPAQIPPSGYTTGKYKTRYANLSPEENFKYCTTYDYEFDDLIADLLNNKNKNFI